MIPTEIIIALAIFALLAVAIVLGVREDRKRRK